MRVANAASFVLLALGLTALGGCEPAEHAAVTSFEQTTPVQPDETPAPEMDAAEAASVDATAGSPTVAVIPEVMCWEELGREPAQKLVDQCSKVSSATHPSCNVRTTCDTIRSEIQRSCAQAASDADLQKACKPA